MGPWPHGFSLLCREACFCDGGWGRRQAWHPNTFLPWASAGRKSEEVAPRPHPSCVVAGALLVQSSCVVEAASKSRLRASVPVLGRPSSWCWLSSRCFHGGTTWALTSSRPGARSLAKPRRKSGCCASGLVQHRHRSENQESGLSLQTSLQAGLLRGAHSQRPGLHRLPRSPRPWRGAAPPALQPCWLAGPVAPRTCEVTVKVTMIETVWFGRLAKWSGFLVIVSCGEN